MCSGRYTDNVEVPGSGCVVMGHTHESQQSRQFLSGAAFFMPNNLMTASAFSHRAVVGCVAQVGDHVLWALHW